MPDIAGWEIIHQSAALRGKGEFQKAIDLVKANIDKLDPTIRTNGWLECFNAAREMGDSEQARLFARECAKDEPELPNIQSYL